MSFISDMQTWFDRLYRGTERETVVQANGRTYIARDTKGDLTYLEVDRFDDTMCLPSPSVSDVDSLITWCLAAEDDYAAVLDADGTTDDRPFGLITIGRAGSTIAETPFAADRHVKRDQAKKYFYARFLPKGTFSATLSYLEMLEWADLLGDRLDNAESVQLSLQQVRAVEGSVAQVSNEGAIIKVETSERKGVEGVAKFQKWLTAHIPFGDPGLTTDVKFRCTVMNDRGSVVFKLDVVENGALDIYQAWMADVLSRGLITTRRSHEDSAKGRWVITKGV